MESNGDAEESCIVFLGSGSSGGTPVIGCVVSNPTCVPCQTAMNDPLCKNRRGNPSLLIQYAIPTSSTSGHLATQSSDEPTSDKALAKVRELRNIVIDVGKTFKASACRFFPQYGVTHLDAIVLTHEHADAVLGLDDVREVTIHKDWKTRGMPDPIPVFLSPVTMDRMHHVFPYLTNNPDPTKPFVLRMVSQLSFNVVQPMEEFVAAGLTLRALPTQHGQDCVCYGFEFGTRQRVVYLSDFAQIPEETMKFIVHRHVDVLVLDALLKESDENTHVGLPGAIQVAKLIKASRTLLVGMSHRFGDHEECNAELRAREDLDGLDIQLAANLYENVLASYISNRSHHV